MLLPTLLHVVAHELLGVVLQDLVDLVEQVVELGLDLLAAARRSQAAASVCSGPASFLLVCRLLLLFPFWRASVLLHAQPGQQVGRPGALRQEFAGVLGCSTQGSIIGTRRNGSVPTSKTRESQLAVTTASRPARQALAAEPARVPAGGSATAPAAWAGVTR